MEGFDIKAVKFDSPDTEELLTGDVVKGLDPASDIQSNAEIEKDEFVQFPDGTTQKAEGDTHEDGGIKMNLPDGTKVLSDNLTLTKKDVKLLREEFDIKASTSDTFATVLEKYNKKIGLHKLHEEQEEVFEVLKMQLENKDISEGTARVNQAYVSKKIYDLEQQKLPKEKQKAEMFNVLFGMQETQKKPEKVEGEPAFKYGGVSTASFDALCKKHGMTSEEGRRMLEDGGMIVPKYALGDTVGDPPFSGTFRVNATPHQYSNEEEYQRVHQNPTEGGGYGKIQTKEDLRNVLENLYRNFPDIVAEKDVLGNYFSLENGKVKLTDAKFDLNKINAGVGRFQDRANTRMKESADVIIKNPTLFSKEQVDAATNYQKNETFTDEGVKAVRGVDQKLGNFTSGRFSLGLDVVTPEELETLQSKGIFTLNQLKDNKDVPLSPESKARLAKIVEIKGEGADFRLDKYTPAVAPIVEKVPEEPAKAPQNPPGKIEDNVKLANKRYPTMFFTPDQGVLPPSAQQAETMVSSRFQRIDPVRIGIEDTLRQLSDSREFVSEQLDTLPPTQRAAALSSLLAQTQESENEAFLKTNQTNAGYQSQAELFNIGQAEKEDTYRANNLLSYEARALTGAAKTEEEFRNYFDFNRKVALNNYETQRNLNLMNSLFPDYNLNFMGTDVNYDPNNPNWQADTSKERMNMLSLVGKQNLI